MTETIERDKLHERFYLPILRYLIKNMPDFNSGEIEDIASEVLLKGWIHMDIEDIDNIEGWLYTVARNTMITKMRSRTRYPTTSLDAKINPAPDSLFQENCLLDYLENPEKYSPENEYEVSSMQEYVRNAVLKLSPNHRETIIYYYFHEFEVIEIAKLMGVKDGTVKSRLARARDILRNGLKNNLYPSENTP